jgi:hypothetical protein
MTYYNINDTDKVYKKSNIRQIVDILQVDIASKYDTTSNGDVTTTPTHTRKKYEVFVTGGLDLSGSVTSSLYQTVFDQDHTYQTSNEMLDLTIGSFSQKNPDGTETINGIIITPDASGKLVFDNNTLMMREKSNIYKQYAHYLLGNSDSAFHVPYESTNENDRIDYALFINFKRLFVRDGLDKEQFSIKIHKSLDEPDSSTNNISGSILSSNTDFKLYSDVGSSSNLNVSPISGHIGSISVDGDSTKVGLIFYNKGIIVLDAEKVFTSTDHIVGPISSVNNSNNVVDFNNDFIPNFWISGSIDNIIDHISDTRFGRDNKSAVGFINQTSINSTIHFCRVGPNDANFSTNPTYIDEDGNIRCIQEKGDDPFTYVTTIGLYGAKDDELLAVAKTSRPIEKNPEVDLSISVRLDY